MAGPITAILNNCIEKSINPRQWKIARISPIPKIDNKEHTEHFRPISILPCISKIFDILVAKQIVNFCDSEAIPLTITLKVSWVGWQDL